MGLEDIMWSEIKQTEKDTVWHHIYMESKKGMYQRQAILYTNYVEECGRSALLAPYFLLEQSGSVSHCWLRGRQKSPWKLAKTSKLLLSQWRSSPVSATGSHRPGSNVLSGVGRSATTWADQALPAHLLGTVLGTQGGWEVEPSEPQMANNLCLPSSQ